MATITWGMAVYDDAEGVYWTVQNLRMYHRSVKKNVELVVVDDNPDSDQGREVRGFITNWVMGSGDLAGVKYVPTAGRTGTAAPRERAVREASAEHVLVTDPHVSLEAGALERLLHYYDANPGTRDLLQGPLLYDSLRADGVSTHFDDVWRSEMWGTWATDYRGLSPDAPPFEIPAQGLGLFSCRKAAWPGFNPYFKEFGGEEWYIHTKVRQGGARCLCLPFLRWLHRFMRVGGVKYPIGRISKVRNYVLGHRELGLPLDRLYHHFVSHDPGNKPLAAHLVEDHSVGHQDTMGKTPAELAEIHARYKISEAAWQELLNGAADVSPAAAQPVPAQLVVTPIVSPVSTANVVPTPPAGYSVAPHTRVDGRFADANNYFSAQFVGEPAAPSGRPDAPLPTQPAAQPTPLPVAPGQPPPQGPAKGGCSCQAANGPCPFKTPGAWLAHLRGPNIQASYKENVDALLLAVQGADSVIELGGERMASTAAILAGALPTLKTLTVVALAAGPGDNWIAELGAANGVEVVFRYADSVEPWDAPAADVVLFDTLHTSDHLYKELLQYAPKARMRLAVHDTTVFAEAGPDGTTGTLPALRKYVGANLEWTVLKEDTGGPGLTVFTRLEAEKKKMPTGIERAATFGKALLRWGMSGGATVSETIYNQRLALCTLCPERTDGQCSACGCVLSKKAGWETEPCPKEKWPGEAKCGVPQ